MDRVRGDHDCGFLRRMWRRGIGIACAAAAVMSLTSCVPQGKAVGDTQESEPEIAHEGVQRQDIVVGVIGSVDTGLDSDVLNAFNKAGLKAPYVSTSMVDDPDAAAQRGVRFMVTRKASVIMIDGIAVNEKNAEDWDAALQSARKAGVPVILLDPVAPPDDDTLFAVTFTLTGKGDGVTALDDAVVTIVDDKPHPRTMNVTDNLS